MIHWLWLIPAVLVGIFIGGISAAVAFTYNEQLEAVNRINSGWKWVGRGNDNKPDHKCR